MPNRFHFNPLSTTLLLALAGSAHAATITVTSHLDDGTACTLREAVDAITDPAAALIISAGPIR